MRLLCKFNNSADENDNDYDLDVATAAAAAAAVAVDEKVLEPSSIESPVTVATEHFWKSIISVEETGAEVTLEDEEEQDYDDESTTHVEHDLYQKLDSLLSPYKNDTEEGGPSSSQLDIEHSLIDGVSSVGSPETPETPMKTPFCGLSVCFPGSSTSSLCRNSKGDLTCDGSSLRLHGCIFSSLGSNNEDGESWHQMIPVLLLPSSYDPLPVERSRACPSPHQRRVMHNRTLHASFKTDRLHKLRRNLHPFHPTTKKERRILHRVNSSASAPIAPTNKETKGRKGLDTTTSHGWHWSCSPHYNSVQSTDRNYFVEVKENDCYDSDPEDYHQETRFHRVPSSAPSEHSSSYSSVRHDDEIAMMALVQHVFKERWTLILHQDKGPPVGIEAWLERGQRLYKSTLAPKFVWLPLHEKSNKVLTRQGSEFAGIDLLDIQRILDMVRVDRRAFPLAQPRRSFMIKSLSGNFCMEARSAAERDRIIRQLKLTVARFGSQLVSGDAGVEDFFVPLSHARPVEPCLLRA
ncbi:hypothetical protein ACA910_012415 [Epithemia clementina (nom. ined.)]